MKEKLLTIRETAHFLGVSEKEVIDLAHKSVIPAYKIGGVYLRFKKDQIEEIKRTSPLFKEGYVEHKYTIVEKIKDFLYYYDFYFVAAIIIGVLLFFIFTND